MSPSHSPSASDHAAVPISDPMDQGSQSTPSSPRPGPEPRTAPSLDYACVRDAANIDAETPETRNGVPSAPSGSSEAPPDEPVTPPVPSPVHLPLPSTTPAQLSLAAMQFLPVPLIVLSSLKTVVLANEAMGRLLGLADAGSTTAGTTTLNQLADHDQHRRHRPDEPATAAMDSLLGQSLSQVGVDMARDGRPVWADWGQVLDGLLEQFEARETTPLADHHHHNINGSSSPGGASYAPGGGARRQSSQNTVIEVIISRKDFSSTVHDPRAAGHSQAAAAPAPPQVCTNMIVTVWEADRGQVYFTLTFTISDSHQSGPLPGIPDPATAAPPTRSSEPNSVPSSEDPLIFLSHESGSPLRRANPTPAAVLSSGGAFLPLGTPSKSPTPNTPSVLQRMTIMKDAILDSIQTPVLAMWKDGSVALSNKAARKLFDKTSDPEECLDGFSLLPAWTLWAEDFTRKLDTSEHPISVLVQTETPFSGRRVGMYDPNGNKAVYEMVGEAIRDDVTGEFLAGVVTARDVTKMAEIITQIKEQDEERFKLICDTMPQLVWTASPDGMHDFYNTRWYNYTGLSEADTLGLGWKSAFHPHDLVEADRLWGRSVRTGEPYVTEYRCRSKDGEWKWFIGRALPLRNKQTGQIEKWFGTCTDVNESIETILMAKQTRQQLLSVIAHSHVTIFTVDLDRNVTMLEGALIWDTLGEDSALDGVGSPWYIGENVYEVFNRLNSKLPHGQRPQFLEPIESILAGLPTVDLQEHEIDDHFYRTRFLPVLGKRIVDGRINDSALEGVIGVILDVTELKSKEADIEAQAREKQQLVANEAAAKEASRLKSQFLANMSHEIRTPITGVLGMAELLLDLELGGEQREYTENIYRSASALLTVINDILDLSKVESGRLDIEEVQFSLSVIVSDVSKMLSFAAERKNLDFQSDIPWDIENDLVVMGDPGRVRQIITNILTNSIKFTNQGYVKFSVFKERETGDMVEIKFVIEDSGIGIEDGVRQRLFQPFSQGDASTARKFGGTGLGLAICKNLLELMHGRITLESTLGTGTSAAFWIPFNKPQDSHPSSLVRIDPLPDRLQSEMSVSCNSSEYEHILSTPPGETSVTTIEKPRLSWHKKSLSSVPPAGPPAPNDEELAAAAAAASADRSKINVLVVEDNAINQQIATKTIKKLGFNVVAAWNGREALDYLTAAKEGKRQKPDIILMDVQMPVIDGYKCTHLLRHHLPYKAYISNVPIVAMTASAIQGDREKCRKAGMDDYLAKPVKSKTLERMLVRWSVTKRRPIPSATQSSESSDCSGTSERCDNADIPGLDHDEVYLTPLVARLSNNNSSSSLDPRDRRRSVGPGLVGTRPGSRSGSGSGLGSPLLRSPPPAEESSNNSNKNESTRIRGPPQSPSSSSPPPPPPADGFGSADGLLPQPEGIQTVRIPEPESDELAMQSRDDKLLDVAETSTTSTLFGHSLPHSLQPPLPVGEALTEENMERLEKEEASKRRP